MLTKLQVRVRPLRKGGPYIGPKGGKYADPQHKIPWSEDADEKTPKPSFEQMKALVDAHGAPKSVSKIAQHINLATAGHVDMSRVRQEVAAGGEHYFKVKIPLSKLNSGTHGKVTPSGKEDLSKPIVVGAGGAVLDGRHRVELARAQGLTELVAFVPAPMLISKALSFDLRKARKLHKRYAFAGMQISVENAKGTTRRWYDPHGKETGSTRMAYDYGYIRRTEGTDGDHVDVYVGPNKESEKVYIVNQMKKPGFTAFDEQKVMLGFNTAQEAKTAYLAHYNSPRFFGSMLSVGLDWFKRKVLDKENHGEAIAKSLSLDLRKADRPPKGWVSVGKKGGYKSPGKDASGKHAYWYPGQPHPQSVKPKKTKPKKKPKPSPTRDTPTGAKPGEHLPVFLHSRATPGTAVHKMESGHFKWMKSRRFTTSEDDHQMRRTSLIPAVDEATKLELMSDFRPLIQSEAKRARRLFGLKDRYALGEDGSALNETHVEMSRSAMEGILKAIDSYKGDVAFAFHAKIWARNQCSALAATQFRAVQLPERHAKNLGRYMAARARASRELGTLSPSPRDVVPYFDLRKKHIHADLPAFGQQEESVRNAQVPDFEKYKLGLGRKGTAAYVQRKTKDGKTERVALQAMRDVVEQPSKLEWAEMYHGFLEGQKSVETIDEEAILPGAGGHGIG